MKKSKRLVILSIIVVTTLVISAFAIVLISSANENNKKSTIGFEDLSWAKIEYVDNYDNVACIPTLNYFDGQVNQDVDFGDDILMSLSDNEVAKLVVPNKIIPLKDGTTKLSISYLGLKAEVDINISKAIPEKLELNENIPLVLEENLFNKESQNFYNLYGKLTTKNGHEYILDRFDGISIENPNIAKLEDMKLTAVNVGETTITFEHMGIKNSLPVIVKNSIVKNIYFAHGADRLSSGDKIEIREKNTADKILLIAELNDGNSIIVNESAKWESSDSNVMDVGDMGDIFANNKGHVSISASYEGFTTNLNIDVLRGTSVKIQIDTNKVEVDDVEISTDEKGALVTELNGMKFVSLNELINVFGGNVVVNENNNNATINFSDETMNSKIVTDQYAVNSNNDMSIYFNNGDLMISEKAISEMLNLGVEYYDGTHTLTIFDQLE